MAFSVQYLQNIILSYFILSYVTDKTLRSENDVWYVK